MSVIIIFFYTRVVGPIDFREKSAEIFFHILFVDVAIDQQVVCWLIQRKARVRVPAQTLKNMKKIS